jgi:diguanylate cyclase (GGDEF)-like protein
MSLARQLAALILALFLLVSAGSFVMAVTRMQGYLDQQLGAHAQDTATSLGLSLAAPLQSDDRAVLEATVDAIFDRGYFQSIRLLRADGSAVVERVSTLDIEAVPAWFVQRLPLHTPIVEAPVMTGWREAGRILVQSHPGYAYLELWRTSTESLAWHAAAALFILVTGLVVLRMLLRPLRAIEQQAAAICEREYPIQTRLPRTPELRRMVLAMNRVAEKVRDLFSAQAEETDRLHAALYQDAVTGLGTRRRFEEQLAAALDESGGISQLALLSVTGLASLNARAGYAAGDAALAQIAERIRVATHEQPPLAIARLSGADFALLMGQDHTDDGLDSLGERLGQALAELRGLGFTTQEADARIGIARSEAGDTPQSLLARADLALQRARGEGGKAWCVLDAAPTRALPMSHADWRVLLEHALATDAIKLFAQPVHDRHGALHHQEVLLRIGMGADQWLPAGYCLPMAWRLGMGAAFDRRVIEAVLGHLAATGRRGAPCAINLSAGALNDTSFLAWLYSTLDTHAVAARQVTLELPTHVAAALPTQVRELAAQLRRRGVGFAVDHLGHEFAALGPLRELRPDYLVLDATMSRTLMDDEARRFYLRALIQTAHTVDLPVFASGVENEGTRSTLMALGADGFQGLAVGPALEVGARGQGPGAGEWK